MTQACIVTLWSGQQRAPWVELRNKDSMARLLTIFITWSALRLFQGILPVAKLVLCSSVQLEDLCSSLLELLWFLRVLDDSTTGFLVLSGFFTNSIFTDVYEYWPFIRMHNNQPPFSIAGLSMLVYLLFRLPYSLEILVILLQEHYIAFRS